MKKRYLLPVFVVAGFALQAGAAPCQDGGAVFCQWATGCYSIDDEYGEPAGLTCAEYIASCVKDGSVFKGVTGLNADNDYGKGLNCLDKGGTWTGQGKDPNRVSRGFCDWGPCEFDPSNDYACLDGGCFEIETDLQDEECGLYATKLSSKSQCPASSLPRADGGTPVQKIKTGIAGLTVVPHGRALHISSPRDASVTLYDLSGNRVFGGKVRAGNSVFSLTSQAPGVYYAVVQSGSLTQKVNVVLK